MCRPRLGRHINRHQPISMSADTRPIPHRHSAATWSILNQHSDNTTLTWSALATEFYPLYSTEKGFQWLSSFFGIYLRQCSCLFSSYVSSSSWLLYTTLVTFGSSSIWGLLLSEVRCFRRAKVDKKNVGATALSSCHTDGFFSSRPCDISQLFVA